ncbi:hypothetical protein KC207_05630 [Phycicoccus sp. BSK3Z-2]|uniref:Uncharacterized protein n=1 Tax=Phycicoccus avicenniae TaxID=2828860 RepID=A0A941D8G4_9MICO|nr:hypothetical protein [Phycicoccus avicenniae]MBR7742770.1 hypothetical protein [Phycicoccus avicenniae]
MAAVASVAEVDPGGAVAGVVGVEGATGADDARRRLSAASSVRAFEVSTGRIPAMSSSVLTFRVVGAPSPTSAPLRGPSRSWGACPAPDGAGCSDGSTAAARSHSPCVGSAVPAVFGST